MSDSIRAGDFRICPSCSSRNKAAHNFCVRCSASMDSAPPSGATQAADWGRPRGARVMRFLIAAGVIAALAVGLVLRTVFRATREVSAVSDDVRADSARTAAAPALPPPVSGWYPGANVPVEPDKAPGWSSSSFPVARPNPYDVPGDPNASMVGIAPRAPQVRAAMNRQRVFTDNDLLATRGTSWSTPTPEPARPQAPPLDDDHVEIAKRESKLSVARSRLDGAQARVNELRARGGGASHDDDLRRSLEDAADDLEDAQKDAAKATRKLEDARRRN